MSFQFQLFERILNKTGSEFEILVGEYNSIESIFEAILSDERINHFRVYSGHGWHEDFTVDKLKK